MSANVSYTPTIRPDNYFLLIEREGAAACKAGLSRDACKYTGFERKCWLDGWDNRHADQTTTP